MTRVHPWVEVIPTPFDGVDHLDHRIARARYGGAMASVLSTNVGRPMQQAVPKGRPTGIGKQPVEQITVADPGPKREGPAGEGVSGVAGDFIGEGRHHGGSDQAVYAVARAELDHWADELGRAMPDGFFGENLTITGLDVDAAEIGDVWRIGSAVLQVSAPRIPCATFAARMQEKGWVRRFAERGRVGAYLRVLQPGTIQPGDPVLVEPAGSGVDVPTSLRAFMGDTEAAQTALDAGVFAGSDRDDLEQVLARG